MDCPRCGDRMRERERDGVTIDVCPDCRGIWLDRGELERLISRAKSDYDDFDRRERDWDRDRDRDRDRRDYDDDSRKEKKKSRWFDALTDIFD